MKSSLKSSLVSRSALLRSLALGTVFTATRRPAIAAYTIVPTGSVRDKTARLAEVEKLYAKTPDDPYAFGEKAQLEYDIRQLEQNTKFVASTREQVRAGSTRFLQRLRVPVDDMREAVQFWREGCGALVLSTRIVDGANVTVVGFGPESLRRDDGAKFALELVESSEPAPMGGEHALQYVQLAMPVFRLSRVMAAGGKIESAYGWTQLTAPGGLPLRVRIDESRRDPFEFVAVRVSAMGAAVEHFTRLGMAAGKPQEGRRLRKNLGLDSLLSSNSLLEESAAAARRRPPAPLAAATFGRDLQPCARRPSPAPRARRLQEGDAFEPEREIGSVYVGYGDPQSNTGLLLLPPLPGKRPKPSLGAQGQPEPTLRAVGAPPASASATERSPDGLPVRFEDEDAYEGSLKAEGAAA